MNQRDILIKYGNTPKAMVIDLLEHSKIEEEINPDMLIGIKPNLVVARPSTEGATTSPELVAGVIEYLQSKGLHKITIMEGSWVGDRTSKAFEVCGYNELSQKYNVPLYDLQKDTYQTIDVSGIKINICNQALAVDYIINIPVLKGHCQTRITCALKNMKGCITDQDKRRFHSMGLHKPIAYLNKALKQSLIVVDGLMGDLNFEEGGNPVQMNRVLLAKDPVLLDAYAASLMGYRVEDVEYIKIAEEIEVGCADVNMANVIELNKDTSVNKMRPSRQVERLSKYIEEKDACSACYGSLIHALDRLDSKGKLGKFKDKKVYIGQGYKEKSCSGIGVGQCTKQFNQFIPGCPPTGKQILDYLNNLE